MNHFSKTIFSWIALWINWFNRLEMVYWTSIYTSCNKEMVLTSEINIIATSSAVLCFSKAVHFSKTFSLWIALWVYWFKRIEMVYWKLISTSSKKEMVLTSEINIIATPISYKCFFPSSWKIFYEPFFENYFFMNCFMN
jgi:hypothetical protein